ncbi:MAG: HNH endonuclease [Selenomonadaceae bacterium]|nr:HNH endonuclease [Selenomonadaceae bacterium]
MIKKRCRRCKEQIKPAYDALMKFYPFTIDDLPGEIWLPVPDYDGYQVSNFGRVKSFKCGKQIITKPTTAMNYLQVCFCKDGKKKHFSVHRLVASCFIPNPDSKPQVNHIDGHPLNNHVSNLEWATSTENNRHALDIGLKKVGQDLYNAKLTNEQVQYIRTNPDSLNTYELAEMFGVNKSTINRIQLGERYKSAGGSVRQSKFKRVSAEVKAQIRAEYQRGVRGCGCEALAKKYGLAQMTIWRIIH